MKKKKSTGNPSRRDAGAFKRLAAELQEKEMMLRGFFDSGDMMRGIVELTGDDILYLRANQASASFLDPAGENLQNRLAGDIGVSGESLRLWIAHYVESRQSGVPVSFEHDVETDNGRRFLSTTVTFLGMGQSGRPRFSYATSDITERKRLEAQFMQAQKMEAIGVLAGGIAHDFNNLLTVINGYTEMLIKEMASDHSRCKDLEHIKNAGERAVSLTSQLLAFSRMQVFELRNVNLNEALARTHSILRRVIGEDIRLVLAPQPGLGLVKADAGQIEQVIMNLAVNARHAMPHGGKLLIETANVNFDEDHVARLAIMPPGSYVMVAISDDGHGMDVETQERIFEPFFTTKRQGGTGLGLSTVYGIVKQSGGYIWVDSELNRGTTFKIYLPRVWGEAEPLDPTGKKSGSLHGSETLMVVEDDPSVLALTSRALRCFGYGVLEATKGSDALQAAREFQGKLHLVIADVVLPDMSGGVLSARIQELLPGIGILFVSGYPDDAIVRHGVLEKSVAFLPKPYDLHTLTRKVRDLLDARKNSVSDDKEGSTK